MFVVTFPDDATVSAPAVDAKALLLDFPTFTVATVTLKIVLFHSLLPRHYRILI